MPPRNDLHSSPRGRAFPPLKPRTADARTYHGDERFQSQHLVEQAGRDLMAQQADEGGVEVPRRDRRDSTEAALIGHHDLDRWVALLEVVEQAEEIDPAGPNWIAPMRDREIKPLADVVNDSCRAK
jgi:hypothetical protein